MVPKTRYARLGQLHLAYAGDGGSQVSDTATSPDGIRIAFEADGSGAPGLVFVHGWSCDRTYWANQMRSFAPRHRVVSVDLAGHGESGSGRASWSMPAFGGDVAAVVEQLGLDDVVLIGHSMGGDVIVEAALRLVGRVRGLVWVDVYSDLSETAEAEAEHEDPFIARLRSDFAPEVDRFVRGMFPEDADPALGGSGRRRTWPRHHPTLRSTPCVRPRRTLGPPWPGFAGSSCRSWPSTRPTRGPTFRRCSAPGVRPVFLGHVGHFPMLEAPERFDELLGEVIASFG